MMTFQRRRAVTAVIVAITVAGLVAPAPPQTGGDDDPGDREAERRVLQRTVRENCLICHSDELVGGQRLTPKQWKTEVEKMVGWGSPLPRDQQQAVIDFLSREYPADAPPARPALLTLDKASALEPTDDRTSEFPGQADRGTAVYSRNCANCHGADGQGSDLGTNLVEKPVLYILPRYRDVIRRGRGRMPGFGTALEDAATDDILAWLRSRRYRPTIGTGK